MRTCQACTKQIDTSKDSPRVAKSRLFCSKSCSARFVNIIMPKRGKTSVSAKLDKHPNGGYMWCITCSSSMSNEDCRVFCSTECMSNFWDEHDKRQRRVNKCVDCGYAIARSSTRCRHCAGIGRVSDKIEAWLRGDDTGAQPGNEYVLSRTIRDYLLKEANYSCQECGFNTRHPDGSPILEINHIDGHANNHNRDNLEVLCPNCHALTPNHGSRNAGNGRPKIWVWKNKEAVTGLEPA